MRLAKRSRTRFLKDAIELRLYEKYILRLKRQHEHKFFVQPGDRIATHTTIQGLFECYEIDSISRIIDLYVNSQRARDNVIALDIGANIGSYSVALAKKFKRILAFEPNPYVFKVLEANIQLNRIDNVSPYQIALGEKNETLNLYESEEWNIGMASLTRYHEDARVICRTEVSIGDELVLPLLGPDDAVGYVKIDVEGHECQVISGLRRVLTSHSPIVSLEIGGGKAGADLRDELHKVGYDYFYWIERPKRSALSSNYQKIKDIIFMGTDFHLQALERIENTFYSSIIASNRRLI